MSRRRPDAADSLYLDFALPARDHVSVRELASACGYSPETILAAIDDGRLGAFVLQGRGKGDRLHPRIPLAIARVFLAANSTSLTHELLLNQFRRALLAMPRDIVAHVHAECARQLKDPNRN